MLFNNNLLLSSSVVLGLLVTTGNAVANNFSYTYAEAGILDFDGGDGFVVGGSYAVKPDVFVIGSYSTGELDNVNNVDLSSLAVGVGYHMPLQNNTDGVIGIGYVKASAEAKINGRTLDNDETGFVVRGGVRHMFTDQVEAEANLNHSTVGDSETYLSFGGRYHFNRQFSAGVSISTNDDDTMAIGGRMNF